MVHICLSQLVQLEAYLLAFASSFCVVDSHCLPFKMLQESYAKGAALYACSVIVLGIGGAADALGRTMLRSRSWPHVKGTDVPDFAENLWRYAAGNPDS